MTLPAPAVFAPALTADRLQAVADWLLEELQSTNDDLTRPTDTPWTKGCTTFGRQHARIIHEWHTGKHGWLGMLDTSKALVFTIGNVPCRFTNDDPDNPSKRAVLEVNPYQREFAEFSNAEEPVHFCFVVDHGMDGMADPHVVLHGLSEENIVLCRWASDTVPAFRAEFAARPAAIEVEKPKLVPKQPQSHEERRSDLSASDTSETP